MTVTDVVWAAIAALGSRGTMAALRAERLASTATPDD
jgi:hypothetical protein